MLSEDLFYSGSSHLRIWPFILFEDKVNGQSYGWWRRQKEPYAVSMSRNISALYSHIQAQFLPYHFFVINPELAGSRYFIPPSWRSSKMSKKEMFRLARFFQSRMVLIGTWTVRESDVESILNMKVEMAIYNADNGRRLAEVERFEKWPVETNPVNLVEVFLKRDLGFAKSLGSQLQLIYEEGRLSSHALKITLKGPLMPKDLKLFKKKLISQVKGVIDLKEHIIGQSSLTYLASARGDEEVILNQVKRARFAGFNVDVSRLKNKEIILKVSLKK